MTKKIVFLPPPKHKQLTQTHNITLYLWLSLTSKVKLNVWCYPLILLVWYTHQANFREPAMTSTGRGHCRWLCCRGCKRADVGESCVFPPQTLIDEPKAIRCPAQLRCPARCAQAIAVLTHRINICVQHAVSSCSISVLYHKTNSCQDGSFVTTIWIQYVSYSVCSTWLRFDVFIWWRSGERLKLHKEKWINNDRMARNIETRAMLIVKYYGLQ